MLPLIAILLATCEDTCIAQDEVNARMEILRQFSLDMQSDKSTEEIFRIYLASKGMSGDQSLKRSAAKWTSLLRESLKEIPSSDIEVYKYTDRPEKRKMLKQVDHPDDGDIYVPLEFELHTGPGIVKVEPDNLYTLKIYDEKVYVLFDRNNKMVTWFGLLWGHKMVLMQF
jgi:hypothetical protein